MIQIDRFRVAANELGRNKLVIHERHILGAQHRSVGKRKRLSGVAEDAAAAQEEQAMHVRA